MARKGRSAFDLFVDLAGAGAMMAIASGMEEKHHYKKRKVPNPYTASAIGFATGKLKTTSQIMKLGAILGALGSFDD